MISLTIPHKYKVPLMIHNIEYNKRCPSTPSAPSGFCRLQIHEQKCPNGNQRSVISKHWWQYVHCLPGTTKNQHHAQQLHICSSNLHSIGRHPGEHKTQIFQLTQWRTQPSSPEDCSSMMTHHKDNAKLLKALAAWRVLKRYEDTAETTIADLVKKSGLIRIRIEYQKKVNWPGKMEFHWNTLIKFFFV